MPAGPREESSGPLPAAHGVPLLDTGPSDVTALLYLHEAGLDIGHAARTPVVRALRARGLRVVLPELPRHGSRAGVRPYDRDRDRIAVIGQLAMETPALLDRLGLATCTLIGGSLGGLCALAAAVREPRVRRVGCFSTPLVWPRRWFDRCPGEMAAVAPNHNLLALADRDVFLVRGSADTWSEDAGRAASSVSWGRAGGALHRVVIAGHGHAQTLRVGELLANWAADGNERTQGRIAGGSTPDSDTPEGRTS
jgi:pimeloyl-ACP methyl ester carboxylesterase